MTQETFNYFCYAWIGVGIIAFLGLQFKDAPYGKFTNSKWGPLMSNRWGWVIMEGFVLLVLYSFILSGPKTLSAVDWTIVGLFTAHYVNRSFIYPFRTRTKGKKIPVSIVGMAMFHNLANGFLIGYYLSHFSSYTLDWFTSWQFITGGFLFVFGMFTNIYSDTVLIGLRKNPNDGYKIPYGGPFKYISAPNLGGELLEWIGFAILCWNLPAFCFAFFTFCNLFPRALANHKWYKQQFPDYPKDRKAVIPFVC